MNWTKPSIATTLAATLIASPATAYANYPRPPASVTHFANDPAQPPSPGEPLPLPLPVGSQGVPPGVEVYCPRMFSHPCHQCLGDPAHKCWDR